MLVSNTVLRPKLYDVPISQGTTDLRMAQQLSIHISVQTSLICR